MEVGKFFICRVYSKKCHHIYCKVYKITVNTTKCPPAHANIEDDDDVNMITVIRYSMFLTLLTTSQVARSEEAKRTGLGPDNHLNWQICEVSNAEMYHNSGRNIYSRSQNCCISFQDVKIKRIC